MNIHDFAENRNLDLRQIMDFTSDVNPIGPSNKAKHSIRKGAKDLIFPPDEKLRYLRRYICKKEQVGEDNILFGQGLHHILSALIHAVGPRAVVLVSPVSERYREVLAGRNIEIVTPPSRGEQGFSIDIDNLIKSLKDADILILANPHDVTGTTLSATDLVFLIEEMHRQGKALVIDETYIEFTQAVSPVQQIVKSDRTLVIRSFDLFHALAGLPIGYGIGSPGLVSRVNSIIMPLQISSLAYTAAHASLKDKGYRKRTFRFIEEEKRFVIDGLQQMSGLDVLDTPCNFLLLKTTQPIPDLKDLLQKRAILIDEYDDGNGNTYIKFPIKSHKFNARFIKSLKKITE